MIEDNQNIVITGYDQHGHAIVDSYAIDDVSKEFLLHIARLTAEVKAGHNREIDLTAERDEARNLAKWFLQFARSLTIAEQDLPSLPWEPPERPEE